MRILFALFIALPILSLTLEPGKTVDDFSKELEKKEERKEKIFDLLKKGLELTRYLKIKVCSKEDKNYENCRKNKINYMNNFIDAIEENFGNAHWPLNI